MKKPKTFAQKLKRFFVIFFLVLLTAAVGSALFAYYGNYSTGYRSGVVMKVSHKGMAFKTYEGQLDIGGLEANKDGKMSSVFYFSVNDDQKQILEILEEVSLTKERVRLHYDEKFFVFPWRGETKYFVTKIDRVEREEKQKEEETQSEPAPEPSQEEEETETQTEEPQEQPVESDPRDV